jgi:hypothetical protein
MSGLHGTIGRLGVALVAALLSRDADDADSAFYRISIDVP